VSRQGAKLRETGGGEADSVPLAAPLRLATLAYAAQRGSGRAEEWANVAVVSSCELQKHRDANQMSTFQEFLLTLQADVASGSVLPLASYLAKFPDDPEGVARVYVRIIYDEAKKPNYDDSGDDELSRRYQILRELGRGGQGVVYLAKDTKQERLVAVKVLRFRPDKSSVSHERLLEYEALAQAKCNHPNICAVYDVSRTTGRIRVIMEYVPGPTLADVLRRSGPIPPEATVYLIRQALDGLEVAHSASIIHRDLKPSNIIIGLTPDGSVRARILDFGLAIIDRFDALGAETGVDCPAGTPMYMSPEQHRGEMLDHRTDIYSIGAIAYQMLTNRLFLHDIFTFGQPSNAIHTARGDIKGISAKSIPQWLLNPVLACVSSERDRRPSSVTALRDLLHPPRGLLGFLLFIDPPQFRESGERWWRERVAQHELEVDPNSASDVSS